MIPALLLASAAVATADQSAALSSTALAAADSDAIIVTAAAPALVPALVQQLRVGGVLVAPVGGSASQALVRLVRREDGGVDETTLAAVAFVPLLSGTLD